MCGKHFILVIIILSFVFVSLFIIHFFWKIRDSPHGGGVILILILFIVILVIKINNKNKNNGNHNIIKILKSLSHYRNLEPGAASFSCSREHVAARGCTWLRRLKLNVCRRGFEVLLLVVNMLSN